MNYDQVTVVTAILFAVGAFIYIKWTQTFRIMKRSYIDDIERKALRADDLIADLKAQLSMQYDGSITKQIVAPRTTQMSFDLPSKNSRNFCFPFQLVDPETGEIHIQYLTGKRSDWAAWQAGKIFVYRNRTEMWVEPDELTSRDYIPVLRKTWDRSKKDWYHKQVWIHPDQRLDTDLDTGPFMREEEGIV